MRYEIRPLGPWTEPVTSGRARSGRFRARWADTLTMLGAEVEHLGGDLVVIQIDVTDGELRRDGMLRANAKVDFPGVRVSFSSVHGPLTYATDAYDRWYAGDPPGWQANVRAIALALQALRAVDRYGVTSRGEQYTGWTALPSKPSVMTVVDAARLLVEHAEGDWWSVPDIVSDPAVQARAYRAAARRAHPDAGGDRDLFERLTAARDLLEEAARS